VKIHLRCDHSDSVHTHVTLFIDGANCGQLCLATEDLFHFQKILSEGACKSNEDTFILSGYTAIPTAGSGVA
jgi:hypothetical protein